MKKTLMLIIMVACSSMAMMLIDIYSINISSMILLLVSAFIGIIVFVMKSHAKKREKKE